MPASRLASAGTRSIKYRVTAARKEKGAAYRNESKQLRK